jgi:hypothetical protein
MCEVVGKYSVHYTMINSISLMQTEHRISNDIFQNKTNRGSEKSPLILITEAKGTVGEVQQRVPAPEGI